MKDIEKLFKRTPVLNNQVISHGLDDSKKISWLCTFYFLLFYSSM